MSCKFSDFDGYCTIFDPDFENPGVDEDGICICEDNEDPSITCEDFEKR